MLSYFLVIKGTVKRTLVFSESESEDDATKLLDQQVIPVKLHTLQILQRPNHFIRTICRDQFLYINAPGGHWASSVGKGICWQAWQPEYDSWKTHTVGENEPHKLSSDLYICAVVCVHVHTYMHMYTHTYIQMNKYNKKFKLLAVSFIKLSPLIGHYLVSFNYQLNTTEIT